MKGTTICQQNCPANRPANCPEQATFLTGQLSMLTHVSHLLNTGHDVNGCYWLLHDIVAYRAIFTPDSMQDLGLEIEHCPGKPGQFDYWFSTDRIFIQGQPETL